ncbi:uncharacterized protein PAC_15399 [Phialocephala subalpina]|uniref:Aminoglycoside phosphotransferase domain-containing protein n=1 Tax=Phialocephala subalpina TaxID=576137 RepID=A0A1L7XKC4_9HELO|nr:uncharacterized protein PAC_15399 [Phialocephala subalpina]
MSETICSKCGHVGSSSDVKPEVEVERTKLPRRVMRDKIEFDNTYHPGVDGSDLVHEVHSMRVGERKLYPGAIPFTSIEISEARGNPKPLCHNCGWTTQQELDSGGYTSRLKVMYLRKNSAIWELGSNGPWMLKDEPNNGNSAWHTDYTAQQFLRKEKPNLPLVEMHKFGGPDDKFHFTIMARAKGSTIGTIWHTLTREQKNDVFQDLKHCVKEWRQITRPHMQRVDGSELRDPIIGNCDGRGCIKTGRDEEEWLENLTPAMRKGFLWLLWIRNNGSGADQCTRASWVEEVDEKVSQMKANFPRGGPYVLTHGDLHEENIFISDENEEKKFKVTAIIDWELAGFLPWWVEFFCSDLPDIMEILGDGQDIFHPGYSTEDLEKLWKTVSPVKDSWQDGGNHTFSSHKPDESNRWHRPPFCACKPYAQEYRDADLGLAPKHLDIFDVDSTDSEDDEKDDGWKKFPKQERSFLRWFNELNNYKSKKAGLDLDSPPLTIR